MTDAAERLRSWTHIGGPSPAEEPYRFLNDVKAALAEARAAGAAAAVERLRPIFAAKRDQMIQDGKDGLADMVTATVVSVAWDDAIAILDAPQEEES